MPVVNYKEYCEMLNRAYEKHYAYPAFNVSNMETVSAVFAGLQEAKSDGIIQISTGGAAYASGMTVKDKVLGATALAEYVHLVSKKYDVNVALHTDHCTKSNIDDYLIPLIELTEHRRKQGLPNLFNSHMFDGSTISLDENLEISKKLLKRCVENEIVLEIEIGVVGGEEDGVNNDGVEKAKLYSTPSDMIKAYEALSGVGGNFIVAATFGNVHGVYKPGNVKLKPKVLLEGKQAIEAKFGADKSFKFVFHGGSGSSKSEIEETLRYGVVKMNIDTDTQYAFTRPIVDHMFKNFEGVLKIEGEVGIKSCYDPRSYLKKAQQSMAKRVVEACVDLKSVDSHIEF